jgi:hypothetical protein
MTDGVVYRPVGFAAKFADGNEGKRDGASGKGAKTDGAITDSSGNAREGEDGCAATDSLANLIALK